MKVAEPVPAPVPPPAEPPPPLRARAEPVRDPARPKAEADAQAQPASLQANDTRIIQPVQPKRRLIGWLVVMSGADAGTDHRITSRSLTIGRDESCDVTVAHDTISRLHARIEYRDKQFVFTDAGSSNGSACNGERVTRAVLEDGDVLQVGEVRLLFKIARPRHRPTKP
jgi:pSer/pThr/pTyr-binding forkhead associated (FHA) protein